MCEDLCFFFAGILIRGVPCLFFFLLICVGFIGVRVGGEKVGGSTRCRSGWIVSGEIWFSIRNVS